MGRIATWLVLLSVVVLLTCSASRRGIDGDPVVLVSGNLDTETSEMVLSYNGTAGLELSSVGWQMGTGATVPTLALASNTLTLYTYAGTTGSQYNLRLDTGSSHVDSYIELDASNVRYGANQNFAETFDAGAGSDYIARYTSSATTFNYGQADLDTMFSGSGAGNLLKIDAGEYEVIIGGATPNALLTVDGVVSLKEVAAPGNTAAYGKLYADSGDTLLYFVASDGTAYDLTAGGGGGGDSDWTVSGTDLVPFTAGNDVVLRAGETMGISAGAAGTEVLFFSVTADADSRFSIEAGGDLNWGDGTAVPDVRLYRSAADTLSLDDLLAVASAATSGSTLSVTRDLALASTDSPVVSIVQDNASDDQAAFVIQQDGIGIGLAVFGNQSEVAIQAVSNTATAIQAHASASSGVIHGIYGYTDSSHNEAYGGRFDQTFVGRDTTYFEQNPAVSPALADPPGGQGRLGCTAGDWFTWVNSDGKAYSYADADGDTLVHVEESADEDKIRLDTGGTERVVIDSTGVDCSVEVSATGNFDVGGVNGVSGLVTVITDVDINTQQVKTRELTFTGGIITSIGAESGWTPAPLNP